MTCAFNMSKFKARTAWYNGENGEYWDSDDLDAGRGDWLCCACGCRFDDHSTWPHGKWDGAKHVRRFYDLSKVEAAEYAPGDTCPHCGEKLSSAPRLRETDPQAVFCLGCAKLGLDDLIKLGTN